MRGLLPLSFAPMSVMNNFIAVVKVVWELSVRAGLLHWSWEHGCWIGGMGWWISKCITYGIHFDVLLFSLASLLIPSILDIKLNFFLYALFFFFKPTVNNLKETAWIFLGRKV